jgi:hypothetical protein
VLCVKGTKQFSIWTEGVGLWGGRLFSFTHKKLFKTADKQHTFFVVFFGNAF